MNPEKLEHIRHSLAHILAAAVLEYDPKAQLGIGPAIDTGFYYDILFSTPFSENELPRIQKRMKEIIKEGLPFSGTEVNKKEAQDLFTDQSFKQELINEFAQEGRTLTAYKTGDLFIDLCRGGHVDSTSEIDPESFELDRISGAYWKGDQKNKQLTRIYGLAFENKDALEGHKKMREEAKLRDHRKIGQEMELFTISDMVGKGLPLWLPKGTLIKDAIVNLAKKMEEKYGYVRVSTPHLAKEDLYLTSGHLPYYKESMYPEMVMDDGTYYLRAMNCPHHHVIYSTRPRSYRELPLRLAEYGMVYRNELSGTLAGLLRVRSLEMNDAHIYCTKEQIRDELKSVLTMTQEYFALFGLTDYWFRLSKWDKTHTDKYINEPDNWEFAEGVIRDVLEESGVRFTEVADEAAFYGPKIDVQFTSVIGREETMSTIQLDFAAKERFNLSYIDTTGTENHDVFVIHRAPLSTNERFIAFLIEHYAGAFPLWLSPVQVALLPINEDVVPYAEIAQETLRRAGIRTELYNENETLGKKIRRAKLEKIPYVLVIGNQEKEKGEVMVESRTDGKIGSQTIDTFIETIRNHIAPRV
ncbi:MAG: threonine--tRNA ligase [bacterium]|nr:threonine--tRNA ligase [bacterium]